VTRRRLRIVLRLPGRQSTISLFVAGSIAVHLVLAVVLVLLPLGRKRANAASDSMVVELAGPLPGPPSPSVAPPSQAPPAPRVEPPAPETKPAEPKGPSLTEPPKEKDPKKKKEEEKKAPPPAEPAPPAQAPPPSPGAGGSGPAAPGSGGIVGGGGAGALEPGSSELAWYWSSVTAVLRSHWVRPVLEGAGGVLTVTLTFDVRRDGTVQNVTVESGSGVPSLDRSALRAVADASPLPPVPASFKEATLSARYVFELTPGD
jgi:TonB family protein